MNCHPCFDKILSYALGETEGGEREEVRRHLDSCASCGRELRSFETLSAGLSSLPRVEPGAELWERVETAAREEEAFRAGSTVWLFRLLARPAVAAAALLVAGLFIFFAWHGPRKQVPDEAVGVAEMGSKIAHADLASRELRAALDAYLDDVRSVISESAECAAFRDAGRWRKLKEKIAKRDMVYRGLMLRARLSEMKGSGEEEGRAGDLAIIEDSVRLMRWISESAPEALSSGTRMEARAREMEDLARRLGEGGGR